MADSGHDLLIGGKDRDSMKSGSGNDTLYGEGGDDHMTSSTGDDSLHGGDGLDIMYAGDGSDTIFGQNGRDYMFGGNERDRLYGGTGRDFLYGDEGNDVLFGEEGNDVLFGGEGDDALISNNGNDALTGGKGNDVFVYNTNAAFNRNTIGTDTISDFGDGNDKIYLDKTTFKALSSIPGFGFSKANEFAVVSQDSLVDRSAAKIIFSRGTGNLFYNENASNPGLGSGGHFATLYDVNSLTGWHFKISN